MKKVLERIELKKQEYARLPFFQFVRNASIEPRRRLAWAPYAAPFVMSFVDLNKYVFRVEPTQDPLQDIINRHTYEDDRHWLWFLEDLEKLGFDKSLHLSDALKFFWGKETQQSRYLTYELCRYALGATPMQKVVVIETIEAAGNVQFAAAALASRDLQAISGERYLYFGDVHSAVETGRTFGSIAAEQFIENIQLTSQEQQAAFELVDAIFAILTNWKHDLLVRAQSYQIEATFPYQRGRFASRLPNFLK